MVVATDQSNMDMDYTVLSFFSHPKIWFAFSFRCSFVRMKSVLNNFLMYLDSRLEVTRSLLKCVSCPQPAVWANFLCPASRAQVAGDGLACQPAKLLCWGAYF